MYACVLPVCMGVCDTHKSVFLGGGGGTELKKDGNAGAILVSSLLVKIKEVCAQYLRVYTFEYSAAFLALGIHVELNRRTHLAREQIGGDLREGDLYIHSSPRVRKNA